MFLKKKSIMTITDNVHTLLRSIPPGVIVEAAAKTRTANEIIEAVAAGITTIGENYLQESIDVINEVGDIAKWHYIGQLQKGKIKKIVDLFDMIETVDSFEAASRIDKYAALQDKVMPVLVGINSGKESQKSGVYPLDALEVVQSISELENVRILGLMTMGPWMEDSEKLRPYFSLTRALFDKLSAQNIPNVKMEVLSMGMSASYRVAIEEGANLVRIGEGIFGSRKYR